MQPYEQFQCEKHQCRCKRPLGDGSYLVHCPAHEDDTASLHASPKNGRWLWHCFAGCEFAAIRPHLPEKAAPREAAELYASYPYVSPSGELVGWKLRSRAKRIWWVRPDGTPGLPEGGARNLPLYRVLQVLEAPEGAIVWVTEGEKAADALVRAGHVATCPAWSASIPAVVDPSVWEPLRGRDVVLWRDNDEPGRKWAGRLGSILRPIVRSLRIVVASDLGEGADAYDYIEAGLDPMRLLEDVVIRPVGEDGFDAVFREEQGAVTWHVRKVLRISRALNASIRVQPSWERVAYHADLDLSSQSSRELLGRNLRGAYGKDVNWNLQVLRIAQEAADVAGGQRVLSRLSDMAEAEETEVVEGLVTDTVTLWFGIGGSHKSTLAMSLALAVSGGRSEWLGNRIERHGPVIYVDYEDAPYVASKAKKIARGMGLPEEAVADVWIYDPRGTPLADFADDLCERVQEIRPALVIVDGVMQAVGGAPEDATAAISFFRAADKLGVPFLGITHANRTDAAMSRSGRVPSHPYGSVVWHNRPRRIMFVRSKRIGAYGHLVELWDTKRNRAATYDEEPLRLLVTYGSGEIRIDAPSWLEALEDAASVPKGQAAFAFTEEDDG